MSDENKKPDPIEDVRKGLGLLFRAAKNAVSELPTGRVEEVVETGLREVGRAVENVVHTIGREVFKEAAAPEKTPSAEPARAEPASATSATSDASKDEAKQDPPAASPGQSVEDAPRNSPGNAADHVRIDKS